MRDISPLRRHDSAKYFNRRPSYNKYKNIRPNSEAHHYKWTFKCYITSKIGRLFAESCRVFHEVGDFRSLFLLLTQREGAAFEFGRVLLPRAAPPTVATPEFIHSSIEAGTRRVSVTIRPREFTWKNINNKIVVRHFEKIICV